MRKQIITFLTLFVLLVSLVGCNNTKPPANSEDTTEAAPQTSEESSSESESENALRLQKYLNMTPEDIVAELTLEEKVAQMLQPLGDLANPDMMEEKGYGSVLGDWGKSSEEWRSFVLSLQEGVLKSSAGIPYMYGQDAVHGVNNATGTVIFPHNIGIGAANDKELTYKMGLAVADEAKLTGFLWSFSPCIASAQDPRWGRTYESYSSDVKLVSELGTEFSKGLIEGGILPCAKHFFADGDVAWGSGEGNMLIDRGDATLNDERVQELLSVYQSLIDAGVKTVMITHGAVNGEKMHMSKYYITDVLKGEMGFDGFVVSDYESIQHIPGSSLKEQVITAVNAGIDMLMEPIEYDNCIDYIIEAIDEGSISEERVNDAVTRIITVKKEMGLFDDPMMENQDTKQSEVGSDEYRDLARQLVEKSLVLLKNENETLPLKEGSTIFLTGPALDDTGVLYGGWTNVWDGKSDFDAGRRLDPDCKTILNGFEEIADAYNFTIITDPEQADDADVTILCIGEKPYAEWNGDTEDLSITGALALPQNQEAIEQAKTLGKPTVTLLVAGRNVIIDEYEKNWDAVVMCYLPGSESNGIANVLAGKVPFTGKLAMPYYSSVDDIRTDKVKYEIGYGLE